MPSPTQNAFMDRIRQMMFRGPVRSPEPQGPDYNEQPSANEAVQIPVGLDGNPIFRPSASLRTSETQTIDWQRIAEQVRVGEHGLGRGNAIEGVDPAFNEWRYAQQAPESVAQRERYLSRDTLQQARDRLMAGNGFYELPNLNHRGIKEAGVRYKGMKCTVLPVISLKAGQVEYCKGSPEPANGTQRIEFEKYAMERIIEWGKKNTQAFK